MGFIVSGSAAVAAVTPGIDINTVLSGLALAGGGAVIWKIVLLLLDKIVPSRSDKRNDVEASFGVLSKTIEILANEKTSDSAALTRANQRIHTLEIEGNTDYDTIRLLREAKAELEERIALKDRHIAQLTAKLAEYGAKVSFDGEGHLHIDTAKAQNTGPIPTV